MTDKKTSKPKRSKKQGLSDSELIEKYESDGSIDLGETLEATLKKKKIELKNNGFQ